MRGNSPARFGGRERLQSPTHPYWLFSEIYVYGHEKFGYTQAEKYHAELIATFQLLADTPFICPERSEFVPSVRIHHHGRHLIVYTVETNHILIVRVLHDRVDPARHL